MRDSMIFYRSFAEAIKDLDEDDQLAAFWNIVNYALDGTEPSEPGAARAVFKMARPQIDVNSKRYENGKRGGRSSGKRENENVNTEPDWNQQETKQQNCETKQQNQETKTVKPETKLEDEKTKQEPNANQTETKTEPNRNQNGTKQEPNRNQTETKQKPNAGQSVTKSEPNVNVNDNVNDNVNSIYINSRDNNLQGKKDNKYIYSRETGKNSEAVERIVNYLNRKCGTKYRTNSSNTTKHIQARLNEGFTEEDFKTVIDKKYKEWNGTEYEKYLRPETLFCSKFESYLNQKINDKQEERNLDWEAWGND